MKIAFGYKLRSGKDTSVDYLIRKYGGVKVSFSEPLYEILHYAQKVCNFPIEKDRWFLQNIGTEWARNKDEDVWLKLFNEKIKTLDSNINVYNSDIRFKNELENMKNQGFLCIKINRNIENNNSSKHLSEIELDSVSDDSWDYVIDNNGSLEELYEKLDDIISNNI
jgi:hypothetical protein